MSRRSGRTEARSAFEQFVWNEGINVSKMSRLADMGTPHVFALIAGLHAPSIETAERLRAAASKLLGRELSSMEMFGAGVVKVDLLKLNPNDVDFLLRLADGDVEQAITLLVKEARSADWKLVSDSDLAFGLSRS